MVAEQPRRHEGGQRRRGRRRHRSTTTTGTATRPRPARTPTTRPCTTSATRTRARSSASPAAACSKSASTRRRPRSSSSASPARRPGGDRRSATPWSTRSTPTPRSTPTVKPLAELEPPAGRLGHAQRPAGHRPDDRRQDCSDHGTVPAARTTRGRRGRPARAPAARGRGRSSPLLALVPLGYVATYVVVIGARRDLVAPAGPRPRIGELLRNTDHADGRLHVPLTACSASAAPGWWSAPTCRGAALWHGLLVAPLAVPAFVNSYAWVSAATARRRASAGALLRRHAVLLPARLPPGRRDAAPARPGARGVRRVARALARRRPSSASCCRSCGSRCSAARCSSACTCWPSSAPSLLRFPTFTTAIFDQYQLHLQRRRREHAGRRAGAAVPACCCSPSCGARRPAGTPGSAAAPPGADAAAPSAAWRWPLLARRRRGSSRSPSACPTFVLVRWLVAAPRRVPGRRRWPPALCSTSCSALAGAAASPPSPRSRWPGWPCATAAGSQRLVERSHLRRQRAAGHRRRPGAVVASASGWCRPLYQTAALLVAAYVILFLPRAVVSVRAGAGAGAVVLDDVAHSLGSRPLAAAPAGHAAAHRARPRAPARPWCSWRSSTELTATLLLAPIGTRRSPPSSGRPASRARLRRRRALRPAAGR